MICFIALIVFGILGIFSVAYRKLAAEAFDCVFRKMSFRKCDSRFDERIKSGITGKLMDKSPKAAKFVYRHFETMSWIFTILLIASFAYSAYSLYNVAVYGNCYGANDRGQFCPFDPSTYTQQQQCTVVGDKNQAELNVPPVDGLPSIGPANSKVTIIEVGCFQCPYTIEAYPVVKQVLEEYDGKIKFVFKPFPLRQHTTYSIESVEALWCANEQGKYWEYYDQLFSLNGSCNYALLDSCADNINLKREQFESCLASHKYRERVIQEYQEALDAGIYGTPTFFINNKTLVGPKRFNEMKKIIDSELNK